VDVNEFCFGPLAGDVKKYYSKFDVAVVAQMR
jgi:hypothetical protein